MTRHLHLGRLSVELSWDRPSKSGLSNKPRKKSPDAPWTDRRGLHHFRWYRRRHFDPVGLLAEIRKTLPLSNLPGPGELGPLESLFTEFDQRSFAAWQIGQVRQWKSGVLRDMSFNDLLAVATHSPEGYPNPADNLSAAHAALVKNKLAQNARRAQFEVERRARRITTAVGASAVIFGAVLGALVAVILR